MKYQVAPKRTIVKGREQFPAGRDVSPAKLGLNQSEFQKMVDEGSIIATDSGKSEAPASSGGRGRKRQQQSEPEPEQRGESE